MEKFKHMHTKHKPVLVPCVKDQNCFSSIRLKNPHREYITYSPADIFLTNMRVVHLLHSTIVCFISPVESFLSFVSFSSNCKSDDFTFPPLDYGC